MGVFRRPVPSRAVARPYRSRKAAARTTYRKGRMGSLKRLPRSSGDFGFPDRLQTKLRYCDVVTLTPTTGGRSSWAFRMNSLFDPDFTSTGHQPMWFDQLAAVYKAYRVTGAVLKATFVPSIINTTEATDSGPYIVGITGSTETSLGANSISALLENNNNTTSIVVDKQGATNCETLSQTFSIKRDLGLDTMDGTTGAFVSGNPSASYYCFVWANDMNENATGEVTVKIEIEFNCQFYRQAENITS